ncbi:MAG TPA: GNAT family N-acetyltransferase, partial [Euzebyales bacterium]|nr:GNAT family N-acetyltransferase [Euzebyales bacterium]
MPGVRIAPADDPVACSAVEDLQREVWGLPDRGIVPGEQVRAIVHNGGMLLLAHAGGELVGFCFAFVGLDRDRPIWCSHMLAVRPQWRSRGIGRALKLAQRDLARDRGIHLITWTFDPLQARNAHLNLHRLGARARRYLVDHYGTMDDAINRGLPSDRLVAEWQVAGDAVGTTAGAAADPATGAAADPATGATAAADPATGAAGGPAPRPTAGDLWILPPAGGAGPPRPGAVRDTIPASGGLV